ncbi:MAG TPA: hypothetical protein VGD45_20305 [Steroidobacter sp.]|uniref:hypothetical protein n=1 Tax=Steroidobacter sp. TaxID=1978227 RepID=UPI002EDB77FB
MSASRNLLCKILGHAWQPDGAKFYCVYDCERCGHHGTGHEWDLREWIALRLYWWRYEAGLRWSCLREWWKCSECGGRFGKHNYDEFDHIPF